MSDKLWLLIAFITALVIGAITTYLPAFLLTPIVGILVLILSITRPFSGLILLLVLLQYPVFQSVKVGALEFSVSTIPALGLSFDALLRRRHNLLERLKKWQIMLLLLLSSAFLITSALSTYYTKTAKILPNLLLYCFLLYGIMSTLTSHKQMVIIAKTILILGFIAVFWRELRLIRGQIGIKSLGVNGLIFSLYPAIGVALTLISAPLTGFSIRWRYFSWITLAAISWRIFNFEARAGALASLIMLLISSIILKSYLKTGFILFFGIILIFINVFFRPVIKKNIIETKAAVLQFIDSKNNQKYLTKEDQVRILARDAGIKMFLQRPLIGWGPNRYISLKSTYYAGPNYLQAQTTEGAFNSWIIVLAEMGLLGIIAILFVVLHAIIIPIKSFLVYPDDCNKLCLAFGLSVIGIAVHLFFIDLFYSFAWAHIAIGLAAAGISSQNITSKIPIRHSNAF